MQLWLAHGFSDTFTEFSLSIQLEIEFPTFNEIDEHVQLSHCDREGNFQHSTYSISP